MTVDILSAVEALAGLSGWAPGAGFGRLRGPSVDARGVTTYSPWAMARAAAAGGGDHAAAAVADPPAAEAAGLGSSPDRNSETPVRNGLLGITGYGRRQVRRGCAVLERDRPRLAFWTVTLPPDAMAQIRSLDCWDRFQSALRHRLVEMLTLAGLPPLVVGVAELHPARTAREGAPAPHLHVAFVGRRTRWNCWALDRWRLDAAIGQALGRCGIRCENLAQAGNVQAVRRSVGRYLGKYLSKGGSSLAVCGRNYQGTPRQWWFMSRALLRRVAETTVPLPSGFVAWVHESRQELSAAGVIRTGEIEGLGSGAPSVFWISWADPGGLLAAWGAWAASP